MLLPERLYRYTVEFISNNSQAVLKSVSYILIYLDGLNFFLSPFAIL